MAPRSAADKTRLKNLKGQMDTFTNTDADSDEMVNQLEKVAVEPICDAEDSSAESEGQELTYDSDDSDNSANLDASDSLNSSDVKSFFRFLLDGQAAWRAQMREKSRPSSYKKVCLTSQRPARTIRDHNTKARRTEENLRSQGYQDIRSFFTTKTPFRNTTVMNKRGSDDDDGIFSQIGVALDSTAAELAGHDAFAGVLRLSSTTFRTQANGPPTQGAAAISPVTQGNEATAARMRIYFHGGPSDGQSCCDSTVSDLRKGISHAESRTIGLPIPSGTEHTDRHEISVIPTFTASATRTSAAHSASNGATAASTRTSAIARPSADDARCRPSSAAKLAVESVPRPEVVKRNRESRPPETNAEASKKEEPTQVDQQPNGHDQFQVRPPTAVMDSSSRPKDEVQVSLPSIPPRPSTRLPASLSSTDLRKDVLQGMNSASHPATPMTSPPVIPAGVARATCPSRNDRDISAAHPTGSAEHDAGIERRSVAPSVACVDFCVPKLSDSNGSRSEERRTTPSSTDDACPIIRTPSVSDLRKGKRMRADSGEGVGRVDGSPSLPQPVLSRIHILSSQTTDGGHPIGSAEHDTGIERGSIAPSVVLFIDENQDDREKLENSRDVGEAFFDLPTDDSRARALAELLGRFEAEHEKEEEEEEGGSGVDRRKRRIGKTYHTANPLHLSSKQVEQLDPALLQPMIQQIGVACSETHKTKFRAPNRNDPVLQDAIWRLFCISKDKSLDLLFRSRVTGMLALLSLYTKHKNISWIKASELAANSANRGTHLARSLRRWVREHLENHKVLPVNLYGEWKRSIINDEDFAEEIHLHLQSLGKEFVGPDDVLDYLNRPSVLCQLGRTKPISQRTAENWMKAMNYRYGKVRTGMYVDGHERDDVVEYRQKVFLPLFSMLEKFMLLDGKQEWSGPRIVLVTHDESTFYANDQRRAGWTHSISKPKPQPKGEGSSIMVSDFCTPEDGWLRSTDGTRQARVFFRAGKNREGYFQHEDLMKQAEEAVNIFEDRYSGCIGLFAFDNATTHRKRASNALSARHMPKQTCYWNSKTAPPNGIQMRPGQFRDGSPQSFYLDDRRFKGMAQILQERGYNIDGLNAQCKNFRCADTSLESQCCLRRILYNEPDFRMQKTALEELIEGRSHMCWARGKYYYRMMPRPLNDLEMENNIKTSLDSISLELFERFANRSARFMDAYRNELSGSTAVWANRRFHGHRTLPAWLIREAKNQKL